MNCLRTFIVLFNNISTCSCLSLNSQNSIFLSFKNVGYKVVFLYRKGSVYPFTTGLRSSASRYIDDELLSNLEDRKQGIFLNAVNNGGRIKSELRCYNHCIKNKMMMTIPFETLKEYLASLQLIAEEISYLKERACFYLAAAVSDFYVPEDEVRFCLCFFFCFWFSFSFSFYCVMCHRNSIHLSFSPIMSIFCDRFMVYIPYIFHRPLFTYSIRVFSILPYLILSYLILSYLILSYLILSYLILSYLILSYLILSYHILSYLIISYHILSYLIISYHILSYLILSVRNCLLHICC